MARAEAVHPHLQRASDSAIPYSPFTVLVFAELLRSFGARSETKPIWRMSLFTNINLVAVIAFSIGPQVWSQHNETLGAFF